MRRIDKYGTGREEEKCKFYYIDLRIQGRCKLTGKKCNSICEQFIKIKETKKVKREKKVLGYSGTIYQSDGNIRIDIRAIGRMTKGEFVKRVSEILNASKNWIRQRVGETGNEIEIGLVNEKPAGTIFIITESTKQILESFSPTKEEKEIGYLDYLNELTEDKIKEEKQMKEPRVLSIAQATDLEEIQGYLRLHNGILFDDKGDKIIDVEFDRSDGEIVATLEDGYKRGSQSIEKLYKRMNLVKMLQRRKRGVDRVNEEIKEMQGYYNSDEFQYAEVDRMRSRVTKEKANETAENLEKMVKDRIDAELFLCEVEIKRITKIKMIIENYRNKFEEGRQYFMDLYNEKGQKIA